MRLKLNLLTVLFIVLFQKNISAQTPSTCFEIQSILVDACGLPEGENEMVRFIVGPNPMNASNLTGTWPANPWRGICQDAQTAANVAALNSTIQACGYILEPPGGIIPAGATVILVTSADMNPSFNSFAALSDTIYMIFQCVGNSTGHFRNYTSGAGARTLSLTFTGFCTDAVTYVVDSLIDQNGNHAAGDGATVVFDFAGNATYTNPGCQAPVNQLRATLSADNTNICPGDLINLSAVINGTNFLSYFWTGGAGVYGSPGSLNTTYQSASSSSGSENLFFGIIGLCNDTTYDSLSISFGSGTTPSISVTGSSSFCQGDSAILTASNGSAYMWSTGETTQSITVYTADTYTVNVTDICGGGTASQAITVQPVPVASISGGTTVLCPGQSTTLTASGGDTYLWSPGNSTNVSITISAGGTYSVTASNSCGSDIASVTVTASLLNVTFVADSVTGPAPLTVNFNNNSFGGAPYTWNFGDGSPTTTNTDPQHIFTSNGTYIVTLVGQDSNGCIDTAQVTITVVDDTQITIPNVFTPNADGKNDYFNIFSNKSNLSVDAKIFNRWGREIATWNSSTNSKGWDGKSDGGKEAAEGVYVYIISITHPDGRVEEKNGSVSLIR
ncbi:MAG: PKD domain-containing protein [Bacteroidetes bacterium]|nr:MAG: PKD domain-containing protein [Bacteroidota bacterium]REK07586.1 MAG: PKD domain-containing protein [Bacteroidota bacterium]REK36981.1 MAG: PKD domain-containing protein [Bacteroidota bacterium]REK47802.1 MAG: PKD domain-containing protein [Bacteroidota bacterium]